MTEPTENPQQRLEELGQEIAAARAHADEALGVDPADEQHFYESGTVERDKDDQQIAPPG